jgi:hypothetical protein
LLELRDHGAHRGACDPFRRRPSDTQTHTSVLEESVVRHAIRARMPKPAQRACHPTTRFRSAGSACAGRKLELSPPSRRTNYTRIRTGKLQLLLELLVAGAGLCRGLELGEIEKRELQTGLSCQCAIMEVFTVHQC